MRLRLQFWIPLLAAACASGPLAGQESRAPGGAAFDSSLSGLLDTEGRPFDESRLRGRYRILVFGFTSCADVCPLTLMAVREALLLLGDTSERVIPIFVSFDPTRDTPERLVAYVRAFDPRIQALTAADPVLRRVANGYGIFYQKRLINASANAYVFDHSSAIMVVRPDGSRLAVVSSVGNPSDVGERIYLAIAAAEGLPPKDRGR